MKTAQLIIPGFDFLEVEEVKRISKTSIVLHDGINIYKWLELTELAIFKEKRNDEISKREAAWIIGDLLVYGEANYGEDYSQAIDASCIEPKTAKNRMAVCRAFGPARRREGLYLGHHAELTALSEKDQDRLLDLAIAEQLSVRQLRKLVRDEFPSEKAKAAKAAKEAEEVAEEVENTDMDESKAIEFARKGLFFLETKREKEPLKEWDKQSKEGWLGVCAGFRRIARGLGANGGN